MERSGSRRWAVSIVAALVVGAVLVTGWWLGRPGSVEAEIVVPADGGASHEPADPGNGSGGRPGEAGGNEGDRPAGGSDPVLVEDGVRVDGYAVRGDRLVLRYTTGVPECYGDVAAPRVVEDADSVTVTLVTVPPEDPAEVCIELAVVGRVTVELARPLGRRSVLDGAFEPAVPVRRAADAGGVPSGGT